MNEVGCGGCLQSTSGSYLLGTKVLDFRVRICVFEGSEEKEDRSNVINSTKLGRIVVRRARIQHASVHLKKVRNPKRFAASIS